MNACKLFAVLAVGLGLIAGCPQTGGPAGTDPTSASRPAPTSAPTSHQATQPTTTAPAKELILVLGNDVKLKLVLIPAGTFTMGSPATEANRREDEGPQHKVTISKPFYLAVTEVTQEQYEAVTGADPSTMKGKKHPVDSISWNDAAAFCEKLSSLTGKKVFLPTEAQWEYACRAGSQGKFCFGENDSELVEYAVWGDRGTAAVGGLKPNDWGLHDMHGNLHEWVADWYGPYAADAATDPAGPAEGEKKVLRGGCFHNSPKFCRSASRIMYSPKQADADFGFRVAVEVRTPDTVNRMP